MSEEFGKAMKRMVEDLRSIVKVQTDMAEAFARLQMAIHEETNRRFAVWVEEDFLTPPGWQGFTGIRGIVDEAHISIWDHREHPETFTPEEFNRLWDGFTEQRKIEYVMSLIS